jgi:tetratricopeptide (TPR) repeat protein
MQTRAVELAANSKEATDIDGPLLDSTQMQEANRTQARELAEAREFSRTARLLLESASPALSDRMDAAFYYGQAAEWDQAEEVLTDLLGDTHNGWVYCYLAVVEQRGHPVYQLSPDQRTAIRFWLEQGVKAPYCPEWGVFKLVDLYESDTADPLRFHRAQNLLRWALERHPDSERIRLDLAERYTSGSRPAYGDALEVLGPLLALESPNERILWTSYECLRESGKLSEALVQLRRISGNDQAAVDKYPGILAAEAHLLHALGEHEGAINSLGRLFDHRPANVRISTYLLRAALHDAHGRRELSCADMEDAVDLYFEQPHLGVELGLPVPDSSRYFEGYGFDEISAILDTFADPTRHAELAPRTLGRVQWVRFALDSYAGRGGLSEAEEAMRLAPDPRYHALLVDAYLAAEQFAEALQHHLLRELNRPEPPEFEDPFGIGYDEELEDTSTEIRRKMAAAFVRVLRGVEDATVAEKVFVPVFRDVLWKLFLAHNLWAEIVEVSSHLSLRLPENNTVAFYHAYAANELGDSSTAEMLYRAIIAQHPRNASALNNLAVVREKLGDLDEAQTFFARAAEIEPDKALYRDNVTRLEQKRAAALPGPAPTRPSPPSALEKRERVANAFPVPGRAQRPLDTLSLREAVYFLSLIRFAGTEDPRSIAPISSVEGTYLSPAGRLDEEIVRSLYKAGLIFPRSDSPLDAFVEEGKEGGLAFYLMQVLWSVGGDGTEARERLVTLENLFREGTWPEAWREQWLPLAQQIALEECLAYLVVSLEEHGLPFSPGDKTRVLLNRLLADFAPAQVYSFIWRSARDAAALTQRTQITRPHAANTAISFIQSSAERALVEGWNVKYYRRDRRVPESILSQFFYNTVLRSGGRGLNEPPAKLAPPFIPSVHQP